MIQIVVTLGAFCVACIVLFFMHIAGVEYAQQFDTSTYLIYMIVSVVLLAAGIAYYVYKQQKENCGAGGRGREASFRSAAARPGRSLRFPSEIEKQR